MNESDFEKFLDYLYTMPADRMERLFDRLRESFRNYELTGVENDKVAWRCKQALELLKHRKKV